MQCLGGIPPYQTLFEAQRVGVIPVATDVGAVAEAIRDGETGFLVENHDVAARMTALLRQLVAEPDAASGFVADHFDTALVV